MIKKLLDKIKNSNGIKSVLKISSGTMFGQLLSMVTLPIMTRIYGAATMGVWTTVVSVATIINSFSDLGMSGAIMVGEDDEEVGKIYRVISTLTLMVALIAGVVVYIYYQFVENDNGIELSFFIAFIVIYIWTSQQTQNCYSWLNRKGEYNVLMKNPLINNGTIAVIAILIGLCGMTQHGYYIGCICGQIITIIHMKRRLPKKMFTFHKKDFVDVISTYNRFVKYQLPTNVLANIKNQLPTLLIRSLFGTEMLGYYSITMRILQLPITLLANSIGRVFFKTTSEMKRNNEPLGEYVFINLERALKIAVIPIIGLIAFGKIFIVVFFGREWQIAGDLLSIISCQTLFNFLMMSTNGIHITLDKQNYAMICGISQMISYMFAFMIGRYVFNSIYVAIFLMTIFFIVIQIVYFSSLFEVMNISYKRYLRSVIPAFAFIVIFGLGLRYLVSLIDYSFLSNMLGK